MSLAIENYYKELQNIKDYGGSKKETAIRSAFQRLLGDYANQKGLILVTEISIKSPAGKIITPDGTIKDALRLDWGYWEAKDEADDINQEIDKKFAKGYPKDNIIFEDSQTAILFQYGQEVARVNMKDANALDNILKSFINYERPEVIEFHKAIDLFKIDIPEVTKALRDIISSSAENNKEFIAKSEEFLESCKQAINPNITKEDITEMIIQHILTADIFNTIFDEPYFHRENNIAKQLDELIQTFFNKTLRETLLAKIKIYYNAINAAAAGIADHHEKQKFLKIVYENFYKSYNPKAADRLGVVYTPNEIVRFMVESTDYLLHKHFGRFLADKNVEILDPATGTGTFICDIIDFLPIDKLKYKYQNEIHANEVAILPYYIANLNIEFTYKQRMKNYEEFTNLCFVDTLDNMGFDYKNKQENMFGLSAENTERIKRQNERKISVIIGNPPYNANQMNENDNNKNREYPIIDKRIKDTYIKNSTAQKTKLYDMYSRFYRWAMDRIGEEGIITFITNNSFINARTFDGFRKIIQKEFDYAYIIDLGGNIRENYGNKGVKISNVFDIQVGVGIMLLVKNKNINKLNIKNCVIYYINPYINEESKEDKLQWLSFNKFHNIPFDHIIPDKNNNWLNITDNDWDTMIPIIEKNNHNSLFNIISNGISTNRDEWAYDVSIENLSKKSLYFINEYNGEVQRWYNYKKENNYNDISDESNPVVDNFLHSRNKIKWSKMIKRDKLRKGKFGEYNEKDLRFSMYRPFTKINIYSGYIIIDLIASFNEILPNTLSNNIKNKIISISGIGFTKPFHLLATNHLVDLHATGDSKCLPLYRYTENGERIENITDWGLKIFRDNYNDEISKEDIFHYVYGILHNPEYRKKYEMNLKREFPRIPFYDDFKKWAAWGEKLMNLHINFEEVEKYDLRIEGSGPWDVGIEDKEINNKNNGDTNNDISNKNLSGSECLEGINDSSTGNIYNNKELSEGRNIRNNVSNEKSGNINSLQYIGRSSEEEYKGISSLSIDIQGFDSRIGNTNNDFGDAGIYKQDEKYENIRTTSENREYVGSINQSIEQKPINNRPLTPAPRPKLKADKEQGIIYIDENTTIYNIPKIAWEYKLGNRSALEWILDQYKEKKPKDPTIAEKFNNYKFADYKDKVIDLICRVTTVSVETMNIINEMNNK